MGCLMCALVESRHRLRRSHGNMPTARVERDLLSFGCRYFANVFFSTLTRPVPLEHYIFPAGGEGLHLVVDNKGRFRENNFQVA